MTGKLLKMLQISNQCIINTCCGACLAPPRTYGHIFIYDVQCTLINRDYILTNTYLGLLSSLLDADLQYFLTQVSRFTYLWTRRNYLGIHIQSTVCIDRWGMGTVVTLGSPGGVIVNTLAQNARNMGSIRALGAIFPIFITAMTYRFKSRLIFCI